MKQCNKCGEIKPKETGFFKHKHSRDGYENQCKECVKARRRARYTNTIYEIYCMVTDTYYIGQTKKCITERISKHFSDAKNNREQPLYVDMRMYPREMFSYQIIEKDVPVEKMDELEQKYISEYMQQGKKLYNVELGGKKNCIVKRETRLKQSKTRGCRPFYAINLRTLEIVDRFDMIKDAQNKLNITNIGKVLNKKYYQLKDHTFIYVDEFTNIDDIRKSFEDYRNNQRRKRKF